ncbi:hypothetical protein ACWGB8_14510 [Kitasatospora sp. NPDC054939]
MHITDRLRPDPTPCANSSTTSRRPSPTTPTSPCDSRPLDPKRPARDLLDAEHAGQPHDLSHSHFARLVREAAATHRDRLI